MIIIATAT